MDLDKAQKVNRLAKELLAHGMASNSTDATQKAEEMLAGKAAVSKQPDTLQAEEIRYVSNMIKLLSSDIEQIKQTLKQLHSELLNLKDISNEKQPTEKQSTINIEERNVDTVESTKPEKQELDYFDDSAVSLEKVFYSGHK